MDGAGKTRPGCQIGAAPPFLLARKEPRHEPTDLFATVAMDVRLRLSPSSVWPSADAAPATPPFAGRRPRARSRPARPTYDAVPLIPRDVLFGNPTKVAPALSPDGTQLAYLAPHEGVLNVFVKSTDKDDDRVVTADRLRGIRAVPVGRERQADHLPAGQGRRRELARVRRPRQPAARPATSRRCPRCRPRSSPSSASSPTRSWSASTIATRSCTTSTGSTCAPASARCWSRTTWARWASWPITGCRSGSPRCSSPTAAPSCCTGGGPAAPGASSPAGGPRTCSPRNPVGFAGDDQTLYLLSSVGSNTVELRALDTRTGKERTLASDPSADVDRAVHANPLTHQIEAVGLHPRPPGVEGARPQGGSRTSPPSAKLGDGDRAVVSQDDRNRTWLVRVDDDNGPPHYFSYDRKTPAGHLPVLEPRPSWTRSSWPRCGRSATRRATGSPSTAT